MSEEVKAPETKAPAQPVQRQSNVVISVDKIDEAAAWMAQARAPERYNPQIPFAVVHNSMVALDLEKHMPHPARIREKHTFTDVDSFVRYFNEFKVSHKPQVFASVDNTGLKITSIIDYHEAGEVDKEPAPDAGVQQGFMLPLPRWGSHVAALELKFHPDYAALRANSGKWMEQREFALFVEERLHLFVTPVGAEMLELAQELRGARSAKWIRGKRLENNATQLQYTEDVQAATASGLNVPNNLVLITPLYEGLETKQINAAFSYDITDERELMLQYRLLTTLEERVAQDEVKAKVETGTGMKLLNVK